MGYRISVNESQFTIPADKMAAALAALKAESKREPFHWSNGHAIDEDSLTEAMGTTGWQIESDESGVTGIEFYNEKAGDEERIFTTIAPFVDAGCFIEIRGESSDLWRYVFDGATMKTVQPMISW